MKLLQLIDTLEAGGAERMAVNLSNEWAARGWPETLVVTRNLGTVLSYHHQPDSVVCLQKKSAFDIRAFIKLVTCVHRFQPDVVHAHATSIVWGVMLKIIFPHLVLVWHDHFGLDPTVHTRKYMRFLFPFISFIISVKRELVSWAKQNGAQIPIAFISNFASLPEFAESEKSSIIVCLANYRRQKDIGNLIDAAAILRNSGREFSIRIHGNEADASYIAELNQQVAQLELTHTVHLFGPVERAESELAGATLGVLSSQSEGLPIALLEYGLAGLPVVVTDAGACAEVVQDGIHGYVVPVKNSKALADAMERILDNPKQSIQMGKAFKEHVQACYSAAAFIKHYLDLLYTPHV